MSESIGEAYIRIIAKGDDVKPGIEKSFQDAEPSVRDAARDHGKTYSKEFDKEVRKGYKGQFKKTQGEMFDELNESMTKALARLELSDRFFKSAKWKKFRSRLGDEGGKAGDLLGQRMEQRFRDSGSLEGLAGSMKDLGPALRAAQRDIINQMHVEALQMDRSFNRQKKVQDQERLAALRSMLNEAYAMNKLFDQRVRTLAKEQDRVAQIVSIENRRRLQEGKRLLKEREVAVAAENKKALDGLARYVTHLDAVERGERTLTLSRRRNLSYLRDMRTYLSDNNLLTDEHSRTLALQTRRLDDLHPRLVRVNRGIDVFADRLAKGFGSGSRNNFLNFLGGLAGGIARIPRLFTAAAGGVSSWVRDIRSAPGVMGKLSAGLGPLLKNVYVLGAALAAVMVVAGPLVATISLLTGVLTALASSVLLGAIAGLGALGGAAVVAGAGLAVLIAGVRNVPKAAKVAFGQVGKEFKALGRIAGENIFRRAESQASGFARVLSRLRPITGGIGRAISDVGTYFLRLTQGPGFTRFLRSMQSFLPDAVRSLGRTTGNVFAGIGGTLTALTPLINRFLGWIERSTKRFSEFANSAGGQRKIEDFFRRAGDSAASLGGLLGNIGRLLGTVMNAGAKPGNSLIDSMARAVGRWNDALRADPEILQRWFDKAVEFGRQMGHVATEAGKLFDALDNPGTRNAVIQTFQGIALAAQAVAIPLQNMMILAGGVGKAMGGLALAAGKTLGLLSKVPGMDWLKPIAGDLQDAGRSMLGWGKDTEAAGRKAGEAARQANALYAAVDKAGFKRRSLNIAVKTLGMKPTLAQFSELARRFKLTPKQIRMIAKMNGFELTASRYRALVRAAKGLDKTKSRPVVRLRDEATKKGKDIGRLLNDVGRRKPTPKAALNDRAARLSLLTLDRSVSRLDRRHAKPNASLSPRSANGSIALITRNLSSLGRRTARPGVSVQTASAFAGIRAVGSALAGLRSKTINIHTNYTRSGQGMARATAIGGTFHSAQTRLIAEAGSEAVVPLNRPLSQVDPSVRWLSAIAQGKSPVTNNSRTDSSRSVTIQSLHVTTSAPDPQGQIEEMLNQLVHRL